MENINQSTDSEYLGITEAADYLRVSASTLRRWEKKGFLVPERTPTGIRRYTKKQLDDVIQTPAYEKPAVSNAKPQPEEISPRAQTISTNDDFYVENESKEELVDEYIQIVEPNSSEQIAQDEIDSQIAARPASYKSSNEVPQYIPQEYSKPELPVGENKSYFDIFEKYKEEKKESRPSEENYPPKEENRTLDNFATVEQQKFNHIFDIRENGESESEIELEEYDADAAYVYSEPRSSSYSNVDKSSEKEKVKKKSLFFWKPVFLFVSLFLAIIIISLIAYYAFSSTGTSGGPLNPVID